MALTKNLTYQLLLCLLFLFAGGCGGKDKNNKINSAELAAQKAAGVCVSGNCKDGIGVWQYNDGRRYEGSFIAGRPGGDGTVYLPSGSAFSGKFKYGQYDGQGDVVYANGINAECQKGNCLDGRGLLMFLDGSRYSGEFKNEMQSGYGGLELEDGSTYSGNFADNLYHGKGTITLADGTTYQGVFKKGNLDGEIHIRFAAGHQFMGTFKDGKLIEDQGWVFFPNNTRSTCVNGNCIDGEGTLELDNGASYRGGFLNCSRHGYGVYKFESGAIYKGLFLKGKHHGQGLYIYPSGITYEGDYKDGERHGRGRFTFPNGTSYDVLYRRGKLVEKRL